MIINKDLGEAGTKGVGLRGSIRYCIRYVLNRSQPMASTRAGYSPKARTDKKAGRFSLPFYSDWVLWCSHENFLLDNDTLNHILDPYRRDFLPNPFWTLLSLTKSNPVISRLYTYSNWYNVCAPSAWKFLLLTEGFCGYSAPQAPTEKV